MGAVVESQPFREALDILKRHCEHLGQTVQDDIELLEADSTSKFFVVSVLGEFKRGKSTLLNALLGLDLLPRDVTPTTAVITIVRYSAEPLIVVHWADGREESRAFSRETLFDFTADADFNPDDIDYVEVGLDLPLLADGIVLVDTPGVDDLNHHRSEVACRFVPRSDAVIFVLSAASPVKRSEVDFLDANVLDSGLDALLFVLNFADAADDIESVIVAAKRRLSPVLGGHPIRLIPFSAASSLEAQSEGHDVGDNFLSNPADLLEQLQALAAREGRMHIRDRRLLHRARLCLRGATADVEQSLALAESSIASLELELQEIEKAISRKEERRQRMDAWLEDRRAEVVAIVRKSLRHFQDELTEAILEWVDDYKATDFKEFVEEKIPQRVKKHCKVWAESYAGPMNSLLAQIDSRIVTALGEEFESHVPRLRGENHLRFEGVDGLSLNAADVSKTPQRAGLLAGGAAAVMLLLHASAFVPIIGLAAFPFLMKSMTERDLKSAKEKLRPELERSLDESITAFANRVVSAVSSDIDTLRATAESRFDSLMLELKERVETHLRDRKVSEMNLSDGKKRLQLALDDFGKARELVTIALEQEKIPT